jgi:uncharacterized protein (TIGR03086 family)
MIDLEPATRTMAALIGGVADAQLDAPSPCPDYTVGDLVEHIGGLSIAFAAAARKQMLEGAAQGPSGDASRLGDDWRVEIPRRLADMAAAWRDPAAWTGMTQAGGIDLPGEVAGVVALDELVIHGWDLARSTGQPFECDPSLLVAVNEFVAQFSGPGHEEERAGLFGPEVPVPAEAPLVDRVIGMSGRDPTWSPAATKP